MREQTKRMKIGLIKSKYDQIVQKKLFPSKSDLGLVQRRDILKDKKSLTTNSAYEDFDFSDNAGRKTGFKLPEDDERPP